MSDEEKFSLKGVALTALITFFISGLGGIVVEKYLSRAKPCIVITAVGFVGSDNLLKVPDDLQQASVKCAWGKSLKSYESFGHLKDHEASLSEVDLRLQQGVAVAEDWLSKNQSDSEAASSDTITFQELKACPYVNDDVIASVLVGMIRRSEIPAPPIGMAQMTESNGSPKFPRITDLQENDDGYLLYLRTKQVLFPRDGMPYESQKLALRMLAESFSRGCKANIRHYIGLFVTSSKADRLDIQNELNLIRPLLLEDAHLKLQVSLQNSGGTPVTFRPYFGLRFLHEQFRGKGIIFSPSDTLNITNASEDPEEGKAVNANPFLPISGETIYLNLGAHSIREASLVSTEPLSSLGQDLKQLYGEGLLDCQLVGLTVDGRTIYSDSAPFGERISDEERVQIGKILSPK